MAERQKLNSLQLRKQTLLLESDLNRLTLHAEFERLRESVGWDRLEGARRLLATWTPWLAPIAGLSAAIGVRKVTRRIRPVLRAIGFAAPLLKLWRWRAARKSSRT